MQSAHSVYSRFDFNRQTPGPCFQGETALEADDSCQEHFVLFTQY